MLRMIKLFFWFSVSIIMAYFMADIQIGGRNIKENIDHFLFSSEGKEQINRGINWVGNTYNAAKTGLSEAKKFQNLQKEADQLEASLKAGAAGGMPAQPERKYHEVEPHVPEFTKQDVEKIEALIKKHQ